MKLKLFIIFCLFFWIYEFNPYTVYAQQISPYGSKSVITTGGTAVQAVPGGVNGCYITNPLSAADEGLGATENLYVDPTVSATLTANGTNTTLVNGQSYSCIPHSRLPVSVNAATSGHKFTVIIW